jgi:hypothetical protein
VKREPPRPTFDTPSRTIVIEPVVPVEDPREPVAARDEPPEPPEAPRRDDDARPAPA